ncbi:gas vesicle protein [Streptomyces lushanensis]|uniref:gas vesicle protein n=1 Tax=Streptomyces lushanensis TaxID=1434255 RepID=UPI00082EDE4D|nr:gas vesicle protein [Streptomyces lushanensis]
MTPGARPGDPVTWQEQDGERPLVGRQIALIDLLDRLLTGGVVLTGDLTLSIADVDLVRISLRALIVSIRAESGRAEEQRSRELSVASPALDLPLGPATGTDT